MGFGRVTRLRIGAIKYLKSNSLVLRIFLRPFKMRSDTAAGLSVSIIFSMRRSCDRLLWISGSLNFKNLSLWKASSLSFLSSLLINLSWTLPVSNLFINQCPLAETAGLFPEASVRTTWSNHSFAFFSFVEDEAFFVVSLALFVSVDVVPLSFAGVSLFPPAVFPFDA